MAKLLNHNIKIGTLNTQSLRDDLNLGIAMEFCEKWKLDVLAIQETWRNGNEEFDNIKKGWKWLNHGFKKKCGAGVGFILSPKVKLVEVINHYKGRIISVLCSIGGLKLRISNIYAPTDVSADASKDVFYSELRKAMEGLSKYVKYKPVTVGDFNAVISQSTKKSGLYDSCLGWNNSDVVETSNNGERLLKFTIENKMQLVNTKFRSKRMHRSTHVLPNGIERRLDYICPGTHIGKLIKSCRVYNGPTKLWKSAIGTDHKLLVMDLDIPFGKKQKRYVMKQKSNIKDPKYDMAVLRDDTNQIRKTYSDALNKNLGGDLPEGVDELCETITDAIHVSLECCPNVKRPSTTRPWENLELRNMIHSTKTINDNEHLRRSRKKITRLKTYLKNQYYKQKADEINNAANARKVEHEFALSRKYKIHENTSKVSISNDTLTEYLREHFQLRMVPIPDELLNPREYAYLQDQHFVVNEDPPSELEIQKACEKFANGKSSGTDRIPMESLKYHQSDRLRSALWLLLNTIWSLVTVPTNWLSLSITCLYKKGLKSLPSNYRPLTVGSNISRILPSIIISRLQDSYEHNISDSQFGFRKDCSTCDAIFILNRAIDSHAGTLIALYIDLAAAFDKIPRDLYFMVLAFRTGSMVLVNLMKSMYEGTNGVVKGSESSFDILAGTRQGGIESPTCFNYYFDFVLKIAAKEIDKKYPDGWGIRYDFRIPNCCSNRDQRSRGKLTGVEIVRWILYADDIVLLASHAKEVEDLLNILDKTCTRYGLTISFKKTKTQVFKDQLLGNKASFVKVGETDVENVSEFVYLGHKISTGAHTFVDMQIGSALGKFNEMSKVLCDGRVNMPTRRKLVESCVRSRLTYALQASKIYESDIRKIEGAWYGMLRRMVRNGWKRRRDLDDGEDDDMAYIYRNNDLERIVGTPNIRDFLNVQYLRYIAHICRRENTNLTKKMMFLIPSAKNIINPWIRVARLLGGISLEQAQKSTQDKARFNELLKRNFPYLNK